MNRLLTTRELAEALGASESSIKRWADEGVLRASRTAGGHRRIALAEAIRFVRQTGTTPVRPELLGLPPLAAPAGGGATADAERFQAFLLQGAAAEACGLALSLYLAGSSVSSLMDRVIRPSLLAIGELWPDDEAAVFKEHRAVGICVQVLERLRLTMPPARDGAVALGGGIEDDPYVLPSLGAATVLASVGFEATNLGPRSPLSALLVAAHELKPRLIWVSASVVADREAFRDQLGAFARAVAAQGATVIAGGRALEGFHLVGERNLHLGDSMAELAAFASGLALT